MTAQQQHWLTSHMGEVVEIDGEACVLFYVIPFAGAVALHDQAGRVRLASAERVTRAWLAQNKLIGRET